MVKRFQHLVFRYWLDYIYQSIAPRYVHECNICIFTNGCICALIICIIVIEVTQQEQSIQSDISSQPTLTSSSDVTITTVATGTQPATSSTGSHTTHDGVTSATKGTDFNQQGLLLINSSYL